MNDQDPEPASSPGQTAWVTGLVLCLSAALADVGTAVASEGFAQLGARSIVAGFVAMALIAAIAFCAPAIVLLGALRARPRFLSAGLVALGVFEGTFILLVIELNSLEPPTRLIAFAISTSVGTGVAAFLLTSSICRSSSILVRYAQTLLLALPLLLLEGVTWLWLRRTGAPPGTRWGVLVVGLGTLTLLAMGRGLLISRRLLQGFAGVVVLTGAVQLAGNSRSSSPTPSRGHRVRSVIFVTVDTLRADALSCYGSTRAPTPNVDRLARDSVFFAHAYSPAPWTLPSLASTFTGLSPIVHGFHITWDRVEDALDVPNLPGLMSGAGYRTAAFVANPGVALDTVITRGFQLCYLTQPFPPRRPVGLRILHSADYLSQEPAADEVTHAAIRWLRKNAGADFFVWVHYMDPHSPYAPPPRFQRGAPPRGFTTSFSGGTIRKLQELEWIRSLYDGEVRFVDDSIGELLGEVRRLGLYEDSLIVFSSDHGEEFLEHEVLGHGSTLFEDALKVPLLIKLPHDSAQRRVDQLVETTSLFATVLDVSGLPIPQEIPARSLAPLWGPSPASFRAAPLFATGSLGSVVKESVRIGSLKYVRTLVSGDEVLYDLERDPLERSSIASVAPAELASSRESWRRIHIDAEALRRRYSSRPSSGDRETATQLKALGYVR